MSQVPISNKISSVITRCSAKLALWLAERSSYNRTPLDKLCRLLVDRSVKLEPEEDWRRDPIIDNDLGYDPQDLEKYQHGG